MKGTTEQTRSTSNGLAVRARGLTADTLQQLASRCRANGLFLAVFTADGQLTFQDSQQSGFFTRYALPCLSQDPTIANGNAANSDIRILCSVPGAVAAAFRVVDRKPFVSTVVLVGRDEAFTINERVVQTCAEHVIAENWLEQVAASVPPTNMTTIEQHARLLQGTVNDLLRLGGIEREVETLSTQLSNSYEELSLMYQISSAMRVNQSPREFFRQACQNIMAVIGFRALGVAIDVPGADVEQPLLYGSFTLSSEQIDKLAKQLIQTLRQRKNTLLINSLEMDPSLRWISSHARQLLAVPLMGRDGVLGCIFAIDRLSGEFDTVDSTLLNSIANQSGIYLENSILFEDVRGLLMGLLHSLVNAVDAKDAYTCGHSERVALLSRLLAQQAGLSDQQVERVYMAGLLHDVGKIGVPEAVLQKAGRLTPEEFEQIRKHPEIGARILTGIKQLKDIIPGVLYHHERYDGSGYPSGLAGDNIPLMGRLICLADCFDAMTSTRTYRKALPLDEALVEIRRCAGTQFDPKLTEIFLSIGGDRIRELLVDHKRQTRHLIEQQQQLRAA